ncbi:maleylpyruvate isomerase N-terminal domain-containing protein, partial [Ferrimicrobium acidiphilum]
GFVELVGQIQDPQWHLPGLGVWDVRALVGHSARALVTLETYLNNPLSEGSLIESPAAYFRLMLGDGSDPKQRQIQDEAIAERGREAGRDLGANPIEMISSLASRVLVLVEGVKDDRLLTIPAGVISFANYLPTRTFELSVHSLDIAQALQLELPVVLTDAIAASLELAAQIGALRSDAPELLRLLTGRRTQGGSLSVL